MGKVADSKISNTQHDGNLPDDVLEQLLNEPSERESHEEGGPVNSPKEDHGDFQGDGGRNSSPPRPSSRQDEMKSPSSKRLSFTRKNQPSIQGVLAAVAGARPFSTLKGVSKHPTTSGDDGDDGGVAADAKMPAAPSLNRQSAISSSTAVRSVPGAFEISAPQNHAPLDVGVAVTRDEIPVDPSPSQALLTTTSITAELVDDSAITEAATKPYQEEIDRLQRELQGYRDRQQQEVVQAEPIPAVAAVFDHTSVVSSLRSTASVGSSPFRNSAILEDVSSVNEQDVGTPGKGGPGKGRNLRISSLNLHGREKEIDILQKTLDITDQKQLVMISGPSGSGKSSLASSLKPSVQEEQGLMVSGKFEEFRVDQPYFGIIAACREICTTIQNLRNNPRSRKRSFQDIRSRLTSKLSPEEIQVLATVVPEIQQVTSDVEMSPALVDSALDQGQDSKTRLHFVFREFICIISIVFAPVVMVLDDLQWADSASLELIEVILTDKGLSNLRMICLYRSNEMDPEAVFRRVVEKKDEVSLQMTQIAIDNLSVNQSADVVMDLLGIQGSPSPPAMELASVCHKRTLGNPFFLISFISMLAKEGHLTFDNHTGRHSWDIEAIKSRTAASSNLVDLLKNKMKILPTEMRRLLPLSACLGASFEISKLEILWRLHDTAKPCGSEETASLQESLLAAVREGFLECLDEVSMQYRWIHDKVRESALALIPEEKLCDFKYQVGMILRRELSPPEVDEQIFLIVSLLNQTPQDQLLDQAQKTVLVELNLRAAKKAIVSSAFATAAKYAAVGIMNLPADKWMSNYQLTLDLYSCAVVANEVLGQYDVMKVYCEEVLLQPNCPLLDKIRVKKCLTSQLGNSGKFAEAVDLVLDDLASLGCKFPKSKARRVMMTLSGLIKLKRGVKKRTRGELAAMPIMEDAASIETVKLLDQLATFSYMVGSDITPLALFRILHLTKKEGISELSSPAFAGGALFLNVLGDFASGHALAAYAIGMESKLVSGVSRARTKFLAACVNAWLQPWDEPLELLSEAYSDGMASGDILNAMMAKISYLWLAGMRGKPLEHILADCPAFCEQLKDVKRDESLAFAVLIWQSTLNLSGATSDPMHLQGDVLKDLDIFMKDHNGNKPLIAMIHTFQLRLYAIYGNYEAGAKLFTDHGYDWPKAAPGHALFMDAVFSGGMASYAMARCSGKRKHMKLAMKARSTMKGWARQKNPNVAHYEALLDAEHAVLRKKPKEAERCYQSAIAIANRDGILHDGALSNERCADFMLSVRSNNALAASHLKEAIRLYAKWGSIKKVQQLQEKYSFLL